MFMVMSQVYEDLDMSFIWFENHMNDENKPCERNGKILVLEIIVSIANTNISSLYHFCRDIFQIT